MKKILLILLVLLSTLGFSQNPNWSGYTNDYGSHKFKFYSTRAHYTSLDTVWTPTSQKTGDVWWDNSKKTLSIQTSNTMVRKLITDDSISYYIKQPTATSADNSLLKTVGTSGREVEQTGVTIDDANIVSAPTFSATNLTDGYVPYHISDALGQGNSVIYNDAVNSRVGIGTATPTSALEVFGRTPLIIITDNKDYDENPASLLYFRGKYNSTGAYASWGGIQVGKENSINANLNSYFIIATRLGSVISEKFRITSAGNVGIGCTAPTSKLSVLGTAATNNNLFNYVHDTNKVRTTFANATDSSSVHASSTSTGSPEFHIVGKAGNQLFLQDSVKTVMGSTTNNTTFESDGSMLMAGTATVFDDLFFPFESGESGVTNIPVFVADSSYYTFTVDSTGVSKCIKYFTIQMPHSWKEGSDIFPHVHYKHETAVGTPKFIMKYKWYNTGESTAFGWNWYKMEATTGTDNNTVQMSYNSSNGISGSGKTISSILICQVYLSGVPTNVNAYQFDIHIEKDRLGSRSETSK